MFSKRVLLFLLIIIFSAGLFSSQNTSVVKAQPDVYYSRFIELFEDIQTKGYLSPEGVPYHSVETLMVEAPDYGHLTTSEAFSYYVWLGAVYGRMTGDWSYYKKAWDLTEQYIIPDPNRDQPGVNSYPPGDPADYAPEADLPSEYPTTGSSSFPTGIDPIGNELNATYGSKAIYQMHWLLDVDNWYKYGNHGDGTSRCSYINTYQRGPQESVWETIPHPSWEDFKWGAGSNGGFLPLFNEFGTPARQWRYTSAADADARQIQASFWAHQWAKEQGIAGELAEYTAKAAKMGDFLRYTMFDKYFRPLGVQSGMASGTGYDSCHYLLSWYTSWGGDIGGAWSWRIGASHVHQGYQHPLTAYVLANESVFTPRSPNAQRDWNTSFNRQIEFYEYLQSAEGAIAGGVTNSLGGRYLDYPSGSSTFYNMVYDWQPVYHDPPSNNWFGMQVWSMQRMIELYYLTGNARVKAICDKWVDWALSQTRLKNDGTFEIPVTLSWSGQPDSWAGSKSDNANLHCTVVEWGVDLGVVAGLAKSFTYYAAAEEKWQGAIHLESKETAQQLLDRMWTLYRDDIGLSVAEPRADYSRFNDEVYIPSDYSGINGQGATLQNGITFLELRPDYQNDPDWPRVKTALDQGETPVMRYHRFWAQADIAMANAIYYLFFGNGSAPTPTAVPSPTPIPTPTTPPTEGGNLKVQMFNSNTAASSNMIYVQFKVINTGTTVIDLADVKLQYYYTVDGETSQSFWCDYATIGASNLTGTFVGMSNPVTGADCYLEIGFSSGAKSLAPGNSAEFQIRFAKNDWSNYTQTGDYSFNANANTWVDWQRVTCYLTGELVWGLVP